MEDKEDPASVPTKDTQDVIGPNTTEGQSTVVPESDGEGNTITDDESKESDSQSKDFTSPNTSSDLFCGTPQKTNSRRQPFITLETYSGGKSPCPDTASTFPGPLAKATDGQERTNSSGATSSSAAQRSTGSGSQVSSASSPKETKSNQSFRSDAAESPVRPRECGTTCEPRRLIERLPSRTTEPGAQIETGKKEDEEVASTLEEESLSQEEKPDESQSSVTKTSGEPRRSGRHRVRPSRPSEDPKEPEEKPAHPKRTRSQEAAQSPAHSKPNTRKRPTSEEDNGRERLRTRAQTAPSSESSQTRTSKRVKLYSSSQDFLENVEPKRSSSRDSSQTDLQADGRSQSQGRSGRKSKTSPPTEEESETTTKVLQDAKEATRTEPQQRAEDLQEEDGPKEASEVSTPSPEQRDDAQELGVGEKSKMDEDAKEDSQNTTTKEVETVEAKMVPATPTDSPKTMESSEEILSQDDSKENVLLSQDGQSLRRSRRSKVSSDTEESDEKRKHQKSARPSRACSQGSSPANSQADGRSRRSAQTKSSPLSTPENSQSAEPSNETGRYSSRRSAQASQSKANSSLLESSEPRANLPVAKRRGRKPRVSTQNPASLESDPSVQDIDPSSLNDSQSTQDFQTPQSNLDDSQSTQEDPIPESRLQGPQPVHTNPDTESNSDGLESTEIKPVLESHLDHLQPKRDTTMADDGEPQTEMDCESPSVSPPMGRHSVNDSTSGVALSKHNDGTDLQTAGSHGTDGGQESGSCEASVSSDEPTMSPGVETTLGTEESVEETRESPSQCDAAHQEPVHHPEDQELEGIGPTDVHPCTWNRTDGSSDPNSDSKQEEELACVTEHASSSRDADATDVAPQVKQDVGTETTECRDEDETKTDGAGKACDTASVEVCSASAMTSQRAGEEVFLDSPLKQKDLDGLIGQDLGQSPSSRTRGTWSPSASPSTSILKKGQKRPLEDQTPSPLVKVNPGLVLVQQHISAFVESRLILFSVWLLTR